jgi:hypothetical protein
MNRILNSQRMVRLGICNNRLDNLAKTRRFLSVSCKRFAKKVELREIGKGRSK